MFRNPIESGYRTCLLLAEKGELFGWGNSEYSQLSIVCDDTQVNVPRGLPFTQVGHVTKAAAAGSMCAVLNGECFWQPVHPRGLTYITCLQRKQNSLFL